MIAGIGASIERLRPETQIVGVHAADGVAARQVGVETSRVTREDVGGSIGTFESGIAGLPLFLGILVVIFSSSRFLLPRRSGAAIPASFSEQRSTLVEPYPPRDGLHRLRMRAGPPPIDRPRSSLDLAADGDVPMVTRQTADGGVASAPATFDTNDDLLLPDFDAAGRPATDCGPGSREDPEIRVAGTRFDQASGLAEPVWRGSGRTTTAPSPCSCGLSATSGSSRRMSRRWRRAFGVHGW
ncbi:MAG: hypothetical protein ACOCYE_05220 [Pseudomonadota bacterium]